MPTVSRAEPEQTVYALVDRHPAGRPAVYFGDHVVSYGQLAEQSRRAAAGLAALGIGAGDRVALWLPNTPAWLVLYLACTRLGAMAVAVNTRFRSAEVGDILARAGCKALALWPGFKQIDFSGILQQVDPEALQALRSVVVCSEPGDDDFALPVPGRQRIALRRLLETAPLAVDRGRASSPSNILTTSGTTSKPKFVLHDQAGIARHALDVAPGHGYTAEGATLLQILPFCGAFGLAQAVATLAAGRPMVLMPFFDAGEAVRLVNRYQVTHMNGSNEMFQRMLEASTETVPMPSVRFAGYARFSALPELPEQAARRGLRLRGLYGMSETQALFAIQPENDRALFSLPGGQPVSPQAEVRVCDPDSGAGLPQGQIGELQIRAPSVMREYYGDARATRDAFTEDGFFRTGDLGYSTSATGFVFTGRNGDALRLGGFLVGPGEIEVYMERHPAVEACVVVEGAGKAAGKAVAFVIGAQGVAATEHELIEFCRRGLAKFKVPVRVHFVSAFPTRVGPNGAKVQRNELRQRARELG